jgi:uncharacterized protein YcbK (DUF882 family)
MKRRTLLIALPCVVLGHVAHAAIRPPPSGSRRLSLFNAHTGEKFDGPYRSADGVIGSAVSELSEFLRDHHSGVTATMDIGVIDFLWEVLAEVGTTGATILSAYRTPETNAKLARTTFGVAEHSLHMYGRAIDFTIGSPLQEAMTAARGMRRGGVGWYPRSHFIHIDTGAVRNWELGDTDLQNLLTNLKNGTQSQLRNAALTGRAPPPPPRSQYAGNSGADALIRPSAYTGQGTTYRLIRPSQYAGKS